MTSIKAQTLSKINNEQETPYKMGSVKSTPKFGSGRHSSETIRNKRKDLRNLKNISYRDTSYKTESNYNT